MSGIVLRVMISRTAIVLLAGLALVVASSCKKRSPPGEARASETASGPKKVQAMTKAGTWYEGDPGALGAELDRFLVAASPPPLPGRLVGLISPHAGYRFSGPTAAYGFKALGQARGVRRVVVLGVSHGRPFRGVALPDATHFETPFGLLPVDPAALGLRDRSGFTLLPAAFAQEHSVELQLPFVKRVRPKVAILPLVVGRMDDDLVAQVAEALAPLVSSDTVIVASSDHTHRGGHFRFEVTREPGESTRDAVKRLDFGTMPFFASLDAPGLRRYRQETGITMCGLEPVAVMLATLKKAGLATRSHLLHYTTSGDVTGDWRSTVSYVSLALTATTAASVKGARP